MDYVLHIVTAPSKLESYIGNLRKIQTLIVTPLPRQNKSLDPEQESCSS